MHTEDRIFLVFEFLDMDLKKHMELQPDLHKNQTIIKVTVVGPSFLRNSPFRPCLCAASAGSDRPSLCGGVAVLPVPDGVWHCVLPCPQVPRPCLLSLPLLLPLVEGLNNREGCTFR